MKKGVAIGLCAVLLAGGIAGCSGRSNPVGEGAPAAQGSYVLEDITPQGMTLKEDASAAYHDGTVYLLNDGRLYRMTPEGDDLQAVSFDGTTNSGIVAFSIDEDGNLYVLEEESMDGAGVSDDPVVSRVNSFVLVSYNSPEEEYPDAGGPRSPEEDDGSYVTPAGDENGLGPWNDPDMQPNEDPSSAGGPGSDGSDVVQDSDYGPWNDDGSAGEPENRSGDGPWNDAGNVTESDEGGPASESNAGSSGHSTGTGSTIGAGSGSTANSGSGRSLLGESSPAPGTGSSGGQTPNAGTGSTSQQGGPSGNGELPKTLPILPDGMEGGNMGPGLPDADAPDITTAEVPDMFFFDALGLTKYDSEGRTVWHTTTPHDTIGINYIAQNSCIWILARTGSLFYRQQDGEQVEDAFDVSSYRAFGVNDLTETERAQLGTEDSVLTDMGEYGRLILSRGGNGEMRLKRLYQSN